MFKANLKSLFLAASVVVGSLGLALSAAALTATPDGKPALTNLVQGWDVEGRAGATLGANYELAIGPNGAQTTPASQAAWVWQNGVEVPWSLTWDSQAQTVSFTLGTLKPMIYFLPTPYLGVFTKFSLLTIAQTDPGIVEPGTKIDLFVKTINGCAVNANLQPDCPSTTTPTVVSTPTVSSTTTDTVTSATTPTVTSKSTVTSTPICLNAPTPALLGQPVCSSSTAPTAVSGLVLASHELFFTSSEPIKTMTGTVKMTWSTFNPQANNAGSRVDFQIKGYWFKN